MGLDENSCGWRERISVVEPGQLASSRAAMSAFEWPKELEDNKVSTTKHGKRIFSAALRALGKQDVIKRMEAEKDWRHKYGGYMEELAEAMAASPEAARKAAMAGLTAVHSAFESTAKMAKPGRAFETVVVEGSGGGADGVMVDVAQVQAWADHGACEQGVVTRCEAMSNSDAGLRVPDRVLGERGNAFVVLGATSEMGPTKTLLTLGCTVVAIARKGAEVGSTKWKDLLAFAKASPGTLIAPCGKVTADLDNQAVHCGADVLADAPAIARWLLADETIRAFKTLVVGSYIYLDGEKHVRASVGRGAGRASFPFNVRTRSVPRKDPSFAFAPRDDRPSETELHRVTKIRFFSHALVPRRSRATRSSPRSSRAAAPTACASPTSRARGRSTPSRRRSRSRRWTATRTSRRGRAAGARSARSAAAASRRTRGSPSSPTTASASTSRRASSPSRAPTTPSPRPSRTGAPSSPATTAASSPPTWPRPRAPRR